MALYMTGIRDGHPREAVAAHTGARYTQHSTGVADGQEGFIAFFEPFLARNPKRDIQLVRTLQDGPNVFVHAHQSLNDGEAQWVTMDFFDSDADGKIIEHWDVIEAYGAPNASGRTMVDGQTDIHNRENTSANKNTVASYFDHCLIARNFEKISDYVAVDCLQHAPDLGDGSAALLTKLTGSDEPFSYHELFLTVAEGNFVATLSRARKGEAELCQADLFRLEAGKIVEHWGAVEPVPPRDEWANSGKF